MDNGRIKAETWIAVHHPSVEAWLARYEGIFSRNYSGDFRLCDPGTLTVELSRDGLYEILPSGLFFKGTELQGVDSSDFEWTQKVLKQRRERVKTALLPFDSSFFNHSLALENKLNETLAEKNELLLQTFTGKDHSNAPNPYIRQIAPLLAQAAHIRGNYRTLCKAITCLLGYRTDYKLMENRVRFIVNRPDMDRKTFLNYLDTLEPFFRFVEEWFIPFELQCEFKVRDYGRDSRMEGPNRLLLDYNATLGNKPRKQQTEL